MRFLFFVSAGPEHHRPPIHIFIYMTRCLIVSTGDSPVNGFRARAGAMD